MPVQTRARRGVRRLARTLLSRGAPARADAAAAEPRYDRWLHHYYGDELARLDAACAGAGAEALAGFRELDPDVWALLLTTRYDAYPNVRRLLPDMPEAALQELWTGLSGTALANQSLAFYRKLTDRYARFGPTPLGDSRVLDFGCGWGRLTRMLARDVAPGRLYGCDPVQEILDVCAQTRVPAVLARSEFLPERLPFSEPFELAFSFSVFTHLSEAAHLSCLRALHEGLRPGGILVLTVRPPDFLWFSELMAPLTAGLDARALSAARYFYVPHPTAPLQAPDSRRESTYGEAVVTMAYVRERWSELFELLAVDLLLGDLYQVVLTLRRR
jgi:SAM-dependent methyltransferase